VTKPETARRRTRYAEECATAATGAAPSRSAGPGRSGRLTRGRPAAGATRTGNPSRRVGGVEAGQRAIAGKGVVADAAIEGIVAAPAVVEHAAVGLAEKIVVTLAAQELVVAAPGVAEHEEGFADEMIVALIAIQSVVAAAGGVVHVVVGIADQEVPPAPPRR
jgi:hypothetical protein